MCRGQVKVLTKLVKIFIQIYMKMLKVPDRLSSKTQFEFICDGEKRRAVA